MPTTLLIEIVLALLAGITLGVSVGVLLRARSPSSAAVERLVEDDAAQPVAETLARIESQMRDFESRRQHMFGGLEHHLTSLSRETVALSQALRAPNSRGRWGELTLRRVAELAGMVAQCDFFEQESASADPVLFLRGNASGGRSRPDMVVRLPGGRTLAVDAKVPLAAYLDAEAAHDEVARNSALDRHAQAVSRHVNQLSAREYWSQLQPAPEMVVLFLAGDHFLSAALERDPELLERALAKKVLLATPVTLVSVLKGVSYGWKQERLAQNADEIRRIAGEFYDRIRVFAESYADSGRQLARAVEAYNRSAGSWEARMVPSLKRIRELGVGAGDDAPEPARIDTAVREPQTLSQEPRAVASEPEAVTGEPQALAASQSGGSQGRPFGGSGSST
jgi:DNA recombination protein RmuC